MVDLQQIKEPINKEFRKFEQKFAEAFDTENELLQSVNNYILQKKGKQIRPLITLLASRAFNNPCNDNALRVAIALEMLHTASLIHDDVVDDANERRGQKSVNTQWNNKIAILVGDYLLSQSLSMATQTGNNIIMREITKLGKEISEGELLQISNVQNITIDEKKYTEVIRKKTAALFSTCAYTGAISTGSNEDEAKAIAKFGEIYGICFQIKDDIFDYIAKQEEIGKPIGNDIKEGKVTLPLIYALNKEKSQECEELLKVIKGKDFSDINIKKLITFAIEKGGIEYAEKRILQYKEEAEKSLDVVKNIEVKNALMLMLQHTIERNK